MSAKPPTAPSDSLLAAAGVESAERRSGGCARPVRLRGSKNLVNVETGEVRALYASADELDGITYVKCGNRRASACPTCSHEYKGDAWHLLMCGLAGGKGVPESVADRPCTFVTPTAPSFGPVHGLRDRARQSPQGPPGVPGHGRPLWCGKRHRDDDSHLGQPLCGERTTTPAMWCGSGTPRTWRRFTIGATARPCQARRHEGHSLPHGLPNLVLQGRRVPGAGLVHIHALIRLDGPDGPDGPAALSSPWLTPRGRFTQRPALCTSTPRRLGRDDLPAPGGQADGHLNHQRRCRPRVEARRSAGPP